MVGKLKLYVYVCIGVCVCACACVCARTSVRYVCFPIGSLGLQPSASDD